MSRNIYIVFLLLIPLWIAGNNIYKKNTTVLDVYTNSVLDTSIVSSGASLEIGTTTPHLSFFPEVVVQGEPFLIYLNGLASTTIKNISFNGKNVGVFSYKGKLAALAGIDLSDRAGEHEVTVTLNSGEQLKKIITILTREKIEAPLGIPEKLGGNTPESAKKLVSTLADEAYVLRTIPTVNQILWNGQFIYPLKDSNPVITDEYGYSRATGVYSIAHKGTDFRAKEGTEVVAMNDGVVGLVREFRNYGKTVVIDHGQGMMTLYLHLSQFNVSEGERVNKGQVIGLSGSSGYANGAHLHLSVKVNTVSIDPIKFLTLFE